MDDLAVRPGESAAAPVSRRTLLVGFGALAVAGWIYLETTGDAGSGVVLFAGAFAVLSALTPGFRMAQGRRDVRPAPDKPPPGEQIEALAAPGPAVWLLPFPVLAIMLVTLPLAYHHSPGDNSIVGLAFACALLGGSVGTVLGSRAWTLAMVVVTGSVPDGGRPSPSPAVALRTSYAVAALAAVVAVVGSLFA